MNACANAFLAACELDVLALKPGNVSVHSPGHGMTAEDFRVSARAAAPLVCDPELSVGERVYWAMEATWDVVGCNTNLGILLLAAPLIHAAQQRQQGESLKQRLNRTLAGLTRDDAEWVYRAIRLANPGGLGKSTHHDVAESPRVTLLTAMHEAATRDRIARQYSNGYNDIYETGLSRLRDGRTRWGNEERAVTATYMSFLSAFPDSHVWRKYGPASAEEVLIQAAACQVELAHCQDWEAARGHLEQLDGSFKAAHINPGTSADLTVAACLAERLLLADFDLQRVPVEGSAPERDLRQAEPSFSSIQGVCHGEN